MAHGKKHEHCEHCIHACDPCDAAYCCKCVAEWRNCHQNHWTYYSMYPTPKYPQWISTTGGNYSVSNVTTSSATDEHSHAHI